MAEKVKEQKSVQTWFVLAELINYTSFSHYRECFFTAESALNKYRFLSLINNSFGSGGMSLSFNEAQFGMFIQDLKNSAQCGSTSHPDILATTGAVTGPKDGLNLATLEPSVQHYHSSTRFSLKKHPIHSCIYNIYTDHFQEDKLTNLLTSQGNPCLLIPTRICTFLG
jgi:hypothetical protein